MKKTLFLLTSVAFAATVQAATIVTFADTNVPEWSTHNIGTLNGYPASPGANTTEYTITDDGVKLAMQINAGKLWNYDDATASWSNSAALSGMNATLGTSLSGDDLLNLRYTASGAGGATCHLTYNFGDTVNVGEKATFYFLVVTSAQAQSIPYTNFSVSSGLENSVISVASATGDGFTVGSPNFASNNYGLIKVEGTVSDPSAVKFVSNNAKNGWAMAAYTVVPEPATASLSLLGLAALMMRRRRA